MILKGDLKGFPENFETKDRIPPAVSGPDGENIARSWNQSDCRICRIPPAYELRKNKWRYSIMCGMPRNVRYSALATSRIGLMVFWQHSHICMILGEIGYRSFFSYYLSHNESNFLVALDVTHILLNKITKSLLRSCCVVFNSTW